MVTYTKHCSHWCGYMPSAYCEEFLWYKHLWPKDLNSLFILNQDYGNNVASDHPCWPFVPPLDSVQTLMVHFININFVTVLSDSKAGILIFSSKFMFSNTLYGVCQFHGKDGGIDSLWQNGDFFH